jgi:protein-S-isoprenylcysteine O-methyltransferase Ste14
MAQDAALIVVSAAFVVAHARLVLGGQFTSIFFATEQGLLVWMFLTRRRSQSTSTRVGDWIVATLGGWLILAAQPVGTSHASMEVGGTALQLIGLSCTVVGFLALGRSFGVVAANRGLTVRGPYQIIRHPIYLSHAITMSGFLIANPAAVNFAIAAVVVTCQLMRINAEERVLSDTSDYAAYRAQVRWRLVPHVY